MPDGMFSIRMASDRDRLPLALLIATVAEEREGIAAEPPVDIDALAARWVVEGTLVAVADADSGIVGSLQIRANRHGLGEIAMAVVGEWRGRGVGSALLATGIERSRKQGLHELVLDVFPHNAPALALYRKFGFVQEGRRIKQYRRANGELWDSLDMGLLL